MVATRPASRSPTPSPSWGAEWLKDVPLFTGVDADTLNKVSQCGTETDYAEGDALCVENGSASGNVFVLRTGSVVISRCLEGNQSCLLRLLHAPCLVAFECLALRCPAFLGHNFLRCFGHCARACEDLACAAPRMTSILCML